MNVDDITSVCDDDDFTSDFVSDVGIGTMAVVHVVFSVLGCTTFVLLSFHLLMGFWPTINSLPGRVGFFCVRYEVSSLYSLDLLVYNPQRQLRLRF